MSQPLAISITLCHQFDSKYYDTGKLKSCIVRAAEESEEMLDNVNMVFEDIEDAIYDTQVHSNVIKSIRNSHIVIFEISDVNPNVVYELGVASGLEKPIIILREKSSKEELSTDINQFIYIEYDKNELDRLTGALTHKIAKIYSHYNEIDFISDVLQEKIIDNYMHTHPEDIFVKLDQNNLLKILKNKEDFKIAFEEMLASTQTNFYYMGAMGFLSSGDQWFDIYNKHFDHNKVFSRIVYLQTLKEFHAVYDDEEMLVNYCLWLAQNYYLLKKKIISISFSEDIGIWKNGMSIAVSDERRLLVSTGSFTSEYNNKGFLINNANISQMFKEYAKILALKSKRIKHRNLIEYFSFNEKRRELPKSIHAVLKSGDFKKLRNVCETYVFECLDS